MPTVTVKVDNSIIGSMDNLSAQDKIEIVKISINEANDFKMKYMDYEVLREELSSYNVELPQTIDNLDLGKVNILYSIAQSYHSRISTIEMLSITNYSNWKKVVNYLTSYLRDVESSLLISEEVSNLKNSKMQEAYVRTKTSGIQTKLDKCINELEDAFSFKSLVAVKKKDISSVLDNITRQVKTVKDERGRI